MWETAHISIFLSGRVLNCVYAWSEPAHNFVCGRIDIRGVVSRPNEILMRHISLSAPVLVLPAGEARGTARGRCWRLHVNNTTNVIKQTARCRWAAIFNQSRNPISNVLKAEKEGKKLTKKQRKYKKTKIRKTTGDRERQNKSTLERVL